MYVRRAFETSAPHNRTDWPYCTAAQHMKAALLSANNDWDHMSFRRQLETFNGKDDSATLAAGAGRETEGIWYLTPPAPFASHRYHR